jgi:hypothetical protein
LEGWPPWADAKTYFCLATGGGQPSYSIFTRVLTERASARVNRRQPGRKERYGETKPLSAFDVPLPPCTVIRGVRFAADRRASGSWRIALAEGSGLGALVKVETGSIQANNVASGVTWTRMAFGRSR